MSRPTKEQTALEKNINEQLDVLHKLAPKQRERIGVAIIELLGGGFAAAQYVGVAEKVNPEKPKRGPKPKKEAEIVIAVRGVAPKAKRGRKAKNGEARV
jgi:hypothetical protein